jgi:hypothetical protein
VQWIHDGELTLHTLDAESLAAIVVMGALLDGVLNPIWDAEVSKRLCLAKSPSFRLRLMHFALNNMIWTPVCCILLSGIEQAVSSGVDLAAWRFPWWVGPASASDSSVSLVQPVDMAESLFNDATEASQLDALTSLVAQFLPPPLRLFLRRLVEVSSWTLLDSAADNASVPGD